VRLSQANNQIEPQTSPFLFYEYAGFTTFDLFSLHYRLLPKMALKVGAGALTYDPYKQDALHGSTLLFFAHILFICSQSYPPALPDSRVDGGMAQV